MRRLLLIAACVALLACGKKEEPAPVAAPVAAPDPTTVGCQDVTILRVDPQGEGAFLTYMEHLAHGEGEQPARIARSGNWGQPGEKFRYCE